MSKLMMVGCAIAVAISAAFAAYGATMCSGASVSVKLDLATGTRTAAVSETIRYSTAWVSGAASDATAVVEVNGETLKSATGSGSVIWTPERNGTFTLTHKVMSGNEQVGETLTATFFVEGLNPDEPVFSPESGTVFEGSLSVSISCPTEGATIHYTTDGSEPTAESPIYKRFKVSGKTTVKAVAEKDGMLSGVVTAEYALGRCADPVISLADGTVFEHSDQEVSISWTDTDGVLRYTLDGSDPTAESPVYEGAFAISEFTVVKAKVFSDAFFDSAVVTSSLTRVWVNVATPVIEAAESFTGSKTRVTFSCATEGALIRYTLNGNDPNSHSTKYTGPFDVTESCTVKAYAVLADYLDSAVAAFAITKVWGIGDTMGDPDQAFTTDGETGWIRVTDTTAPNGEAMKSGAVTHNQSSILSTVVTGPGTLSFVWRTSCEEDPEGRYEWDHAEFAVDGEVVRRLDGEHPWQTESVAITGEGAHTVEWRYVKDDVESDGEDAVWVTGFNWESARTATQTTEVPVPYAWLRTHYPDIEDTYEAYEAKAKDVAVNGMEVWACYVVGLDPLEMDRFRITSFPMKADGTPDLDRITISPPKEQWNVLNAVPKVKGKVNLADGQWLDVPDNGASAFRFFRITVELP